MTLTLVSEESTYYVYEDEHGMQTLRAGTGPTFREVVMWDDLDLSDAWYAAVRAYRTGQGTWYGLPGRTFFEQFVRDAVADTESIDFGWCDNCADPVKSDEAEVVNYSSYCQSCYDELVSCSDCGTLVDSSSTYYTLHDESVCESCVNNRYTFCDECDGYYHDDYSSDHSHGGCDCESPAQHFTMRNDGEPALANDQRVTISLPSGVISAEGIQSIAYLVRDCAPEVDWTKPYADQEDVYTARANWYALSGKIVENALGEQWQTREGNFTKRLSRFAHKEFGLKVPPAVLSEVGNVARANSTGVDFAIEVTRNLNLPAEDFYHEESCWWQSYSESRCSLKSNGGIGMRSFDAERGYVTGRAWIMPLRLDEHGNLVATFDSLTPDAFIVFNGYGDLSGYAPARILSHMAGMTYRKIGFRNDPMYINAGGYLVASEEIATDYADRGHLNLHTDTHSSLHATEAAVRSMDDVLVSA